MMYDFRFAISDKSILDAYCPGSATNVMVLVSAVSQLEKSNNALFVISSDSEKSHATASV